MQKFNLILNIHGERPGAPALEAEAEYIPMLHAIHRSFSGLRIVLEHISTRDGVEAVRQCGATVWHFPLRADPRRSHHG